jgi:hypothetical protein
METDSESKVPPFLPFRFCIVENPSESYKGRWISVSLTGEAMVKGLGDHSAGGMNLYVNAAAARRAIDWSM